MKCIPCRHFFTNKNIKAARIIPRNIDIVTITGTGTAIFPTEDEVTSLFLKKKKII